MLRRLILWTLTLVGIAGVVAAQDLNDSKKIQGPEGVAVEAVEETAKSPAAEKVAEDALIDNDAKKAAVEPEKDTQAAPSVAPADAPTGAAVSPDTDEDNDEDEASPAAVPKDRIPSLSLKLSPKEASVGEVLTWELTVKRKKEDTVHLEGGASFGGLEIKGRDKSEMPAEDGWVQETLKVELVGFDPGDVTIPEQKLTVVDFEGHIAEVLTDESYVTIKSLIANEPEPELKEDAGPGEKVMEKDYLLLWILGILGGIAVVAALTLIARRLWSMRKPKPAPPPPPPRPAEEIAYKKLETLKASNLLAEGLIKEFHVRLSEAVREYIGNRFHFDSLELSSEELISAVRKINLTRAEYDLILDFLGETDLVKFAKVLPTVQESQDLLTQSFEFVDRTTPKTAPVEAGESTSAPAGKEADRA